MGQESVCSGVSDVSQRRTGCVPDTEATPLLRCSGGPLDSRPLGKPIVVAPRHSLVVGPGYLLLNT